MNQCVRCNKPCSGELIFCDECLSSLQMHGQRSGLIAKYEGAVVSQHLDSELAPAYPSENVKRSARTVDPPPPQYPQSDASGSFLLFGDDHEAIIPSFSHPTSHETVPMEAHPSDDEFSPYYEDSDFDPSHKNYADVSDRSFERLNDAARLIAEVDPEYPQNGRKPRVSRLAPLRDISAEIQRKSSPLPNTSFSTQPALRKVTGRKAVARKGLDERLPDLWPWLHLNEIDESKDEWLDQVDPLLARRFPSSEAAVKIEREDTRHVLGERISGAWDAVKDGVKHEPQKCLRILFISLSIFAALALMIDTVMVAILEQRSPIGQANLLPTMTLSEHVVKPGGQVIIHLNNFPPSTSVVLSHDIQESVRLKNQSGVVTVDAQGSKNVVMLIDSSWEIGQHTVVAEDVQTRYTASAMLQIGEGPMPPSHLEISANNLDLGSQYVGAHSFEKLTLRNAGGGTINWSASSTNSWLMFSPKNGVFSGLQDIEIAADRANLTPGSYHGKITIISNVNQPQVISVQMVVLALPKNAGAVMSVTPAIMTYIAGDGQANPGDQSLMITNPGTKALHWSIRDSTPQADSNTSSYLNALGVVTNWLSTGTASGVVAPGATANVVVKVNSHLLLPGMYTSALKFVAATGYTALNTPEMVDVTLTVQPACGILLSTGSLNFTAIAGQASTSNQVLSLTGNASCASIVSWHTTSSVPWLTMTPMNGQIKGAEQSITTIAVNPVNLSPGNYTGTITIALAQSTQTVNIQLTVQNPPSPSAPIIGLSALNLNFSLTKGQADPAPQSVIVINTGRSSLIWNAIANPASSWLNVVQKQGTIAPGHIGNLVISVSANSASAGANLGQVILSGVDSKGHPAAGSPQIINVTFRVLAPCTLALPSTSQLAFNTTQGFADPSSQSVMITASGNCNWPVTWQTSYDASANWLHLPTSRGTFTTSGQSAILTVAPSNAGLSAGSHGATVKISATDSTGATIQGSPQPLAIDFIVQPPCTLQANLAGLSFSVAQGQSSNVQNIPLSSTGNCSLPLSWTAHVDSSWLHLSSTSGGDSGGGSSVGVSVNGQGLNVGTTYNGVISVSAVGSGGANVVGNPQIPVTLTVTGSRISVTVNMCQDAICTSPGPLAGAAVFLTDTSGNIVASGTADGSGNASLPNIPVGNYTVLASGNDAADNTYTGSNTIAVAGGPMSIIVDAMSTSSTIIVPGTPTPISSPTPVDTPTPVSSPTP